MKDLFSKQSDEYARFRPVYPVSLVKTIAAFCKEKKVAWDAGTGNGQLAVLLADYFEKVYATDLSEKQIQNAQPAFNVIYSVGDAYHAPLEDQSADLVTVAQAIHWFDFEKFYTEVKRVLKPNGVIFIIGYGVMRSTPDVDAIIQDFYRNVTGPYWDKERKYIDEEYKTIPFPFQQLPCGSFSMKYTWTLEQLCGYFGTWSALQNMKKITGIDPLPSLKQRFSQTGRTEFAIEFPLYILAGNKLAL